MSVINMIEKRIEKEIYHLDEGLESKPQSIKDGIGFMIYSLNCIFKNSNLEDIEDGIVDSSYRNEVHDYGIDAIYLTANNEFITSPDDLDNYNNDTKFVFHILQFKKGTGIDQSTVLKLKEGINKVFVDSNVDRSKNEYMYNLLQNIIEIREQLYEKFPSKQIKVKVYVCFSGITTTIKNNNLINDQLSDIENLLNENGYSNVEIAILGAQELIDLERKTEEIIDIISYVKAFKYITETENDEKLNGYICILNTVEIANLVKKWQSSLFEANIRDFYAKNGNNIKILDTCSSTNEGKYFWSFNNGLTITCHKVEDLPNDKYRLHGLQIVNGCQTSNALYQALRNFERLQELKNKDILSSDELTEKEQLEGKCLNEKSTVLVKIIETHNPDLIYKITETTNSQTPVQVFSLKANEDIHKNIEQFFADYGIYYERRVNFYRNKGISPQKIIDIKKLAQLFSAVINIKPSQARAHAKEMFLINYDDIFPSSNVKQMNYKIYLVPVLIHLKIEKFIRSLLRNKSNKDDYTRALLANGKLHIDSLFLSSILKKDYSEKGIIENFNQIVSTLNDEDLFQKHFDIAIDNFKKIAQSYAGMKKETITLTVRKAELDVRISRFIRSQK